MLIAGIDDCNRSPVLNSLIVAGVLMDDFDLRMLKKEVIIKDSKLMTKQQRLRAFPLIFKYAIDIKVEFITPGLINIIDKKDLGINLNDLEAQAYGYIISCFSDDNQFHPNPHIYVDNFDRTRKKFLERIKKFGYEFKHTKITAVHDADKKYPIVSCASIIAKVISEMEYEWARWKFGEIGSGEPRDKKTIQFLKKNLDSPIIRKSWVTVKRLME
ncbi:MAG: ribonuclease HII [Candidatus Helarchaeota archaeon]